MESIGSKEMVSVLRGKVQSLACSRTSICIWWRMNEWNQARQPLGICRPDWDGSLSRIYHHPTFSTSRMWSAPGKITYVKGLWSTDGKHYCCFAFVFLFLFKGSCSLPFRPGCPPECRILQGWDCVTSLLRPGTQVKRKSHKKYSTSWASKSEQRKENRWWPQKSSRWAEQKEALSSGVGWLRNLTGEMLTLKPQALHQG